MAKVLNSITLDAPAAPITPAILDTFTFTGTPGFTGSGGVQRYDQIWQVNKDGAGYVTIAASATGLITASTNPLSNTNSQSANSITVEVESAGSYVIRMQGASTSGGAYDVTSGTQTVTVSAPIHATTGVLTGQGSTVAGTAARVAGPVTHATTGVLTGPGTTVTGSATRFRVMATSGALTGPGSTVVGTAARSGGTVEHATSGVLTGPGTTVAGSASRFRAFATSGALVGQIGSVSGSADSATVRTSSGALVGQGATVAGTAARVGAPPNHVTSGDLVASIGGISGTAARTGGAVSHDTSGTLTGQGSAIVGAASKSGGEPERVFGGGATSWQKHFWRKIEDEPQAEEIIKVIESVVEVTALDTTDDTLTKQAQAAEQVRIALENMGIAYKEAYREIYTQLITEMRQQQEDEAIATAIAMMI